MKLFRKYIVIVSMIAIGLVAAIVLLGLASDPRSDISIGFQGLTNTARGSMARLQLTNRGSSSVRLNIYCTVYWTNRMGVATNTFCRYNSDYVILDHGEAHVAIIPPPSDAYVWYTSFGYQIRANTMKRIYNYVRRHLPGDWRPN